MLVLNHRRIAQLVGNLKMETAVATYRLQSEWEEYYKTWQQSNTTKLIEQFRDSAQKRIDVCPASVQALVLQLSEEFAKILMSRDQILQDFRTNFRLFAEAPEKTEACLRDLQNLQERLVAIFPEYLEKIYNAFAEELDKIRHELQMLRETLLDEKFVQDEESLEQLVSELGQTVIEQLQMRAEGSLAYLERLARPHEQNDFCVFLCSSSHADEGGAIQPEGFFELELADWCDPRFFRVPAVDNDMVSFVDVPVTSLDSEDWTPVIINNPKDAAFLSPNKERTHLIQRSTHIRILAWSIWPLKRISIFIDGDYQGDAQPSLHQYMAGWA
ncbi:Transmembrane protein 62 [Sparganum proliferum]